MGDSGLLTRRTVLSGLGLAALGGVGAASLLGGGPNAAETGPGAKPFAGQTLRLFIYAGAWERVTKAAFVPQFEAMTGAKVVADPGWWDGIAKLKASPKDAPCYDLMLTDATQGFPGIKEGLFQTFKPDDVPNHRLLAPSVLRNWVFEQGYGVTFPDSVMSLVWNKALLGFQPAAWSDLLHPDPASRIGLYGSFYMSLFTFAALKVAEAGHPGTAHQAMATDLRGVLDYAKRTRDRIAYWWPTAPDMVANLVQENVTIGNLSSSAALGLLREKPTFAGIAPAADRAATQLMWVVPDRARARDLALAAMNFWIGPVMQEALGRNGNMTAIPAIAAKVAAADPVWGRVYPTDEGGIDTIPYYPYDAYLGAWDEITQVWDREILRKKAA